MSLPCSSTLEDESSRSTFVLNLSVDACKVDVGVAVTVCQEQSPFIKLFPEFCFSILFAISFTWPYVSFPRLESG